MMQKVLMMTAAVFVLAMPAVAQGRDEQGASQPKPAATAQKTAGQKTPESAKPQPPRPEPTANIRIDLTITDQRGEGMALSKTMTITVVDTGYGRIRITGDVRTPMGTRPVILNVDAQPRIMKDGKVRVDLSIEYRPIAAEAESEKSTTPGLNESIGVLFEDGKSIVISQSADPVTDRKVKVEAKATILK